MIEIRQTGVLVTAGAITLASFMLLGLSLTAVLGCGLGLVMLAIAAEDARNFIIPDMFSLPAIPAGLLSAGLLSASPGAWNDILLHLVLLSHLTTPASI